MQLAEARKILGLGPDEDPRVHFAEFRRVRERIAEMVRTAPNETLALRYQQGLMEFDQALAAMREHLDSLGLETPPPLPEPAAPADPAAGRPPTSGKAAVLLGLLLLLLAAVAGGAWWYLKTEDEKRIALQQQLIELERQGSQFVENRRWPEAARTFLQIEKLQPGSEVAALGRRQIEDGMLEEQNQFIGYWTGEAQAALDAERWDDAENAARQVLDRFPDDPQAAELLGRIASGREAASWKAALDEARTHYEARDWNAAIAAAGELLAARPDDEAARSLLADATAAKEKMLADRSRARELLAAAVARDRGEFDQQALEWLREAASLAPDDAEIAARLGKMAAYVRTLRVPEDFATPAEALPLARDRDRVVLAAGEWTGPLVVNAGVELLGAGSGETIIRCDAAEGAAVTFGPGAKGAHVSGISFRHDAFDAGAERFSAALVRGGHVRFTDCAFADASGHGLVVVEAGHASASRCRFEGNGWNGVAATGEGTLLEVRDCVSTGNFGHGIEAWDGASVIIARNRCTENSRNGIHADGGTASATVEGNQLVGNREFGLVLGRIASGRAAENVARGNQLGGFVIRATASPLAITGNQAVANGGPGIVMETGLATTDFSGNTASRNKGEQVLTEADLTQPEEPAQDEEDSSAAEPVPAVVDPP